MNIRYHVELSEAERCELIALVGSGKHYARKIKRAQILLAADSGLSDEDIAAAVAVGGSTVYRTKRRFVKGNLEAALKALAEGHVVHPQGRRRVRRAHGYVLDLYAEQITRSDPWYATTKAPPSSSAKRDSRSRPHPDGSSASTMSIAYEYRRNGAVSNVTNNRENLSSDAQPSRGNIMKMGAILRLAPFRRWRWRGPRRLSPSPAPPIRVPS